MSDPFSAAGLALGAASLSVQILEGCKKGYGYFLSAANMPEECGVLKVRLLIEYSRLLDWGETTGLTDQKRHTEYDNRFKMNRALIAAILGEVRTLLKEMSKMSLAHQDLRWDDAALRGENIQADRNKVHSPLRPADITMGKFPQGREPGDGEDNFGSGDSSFGLFKQPIEDIVDQYEFKNLYQETDSDQYPRGFNRIIKLTRGLQSTVSQPKRLIWALKDKEKMENRLHRLKQLTTYLHETTGDSQLKKLEQTTQHTWMGMLQLANSVADLKKLLQAIQASLREEQTEARSLDLDGATIVGSNETRGSAMSSQTSYERLTWFSIVASKSLDVETSQTLLIPDSHIPKLNLDTYSRDRHRTQIQYHGQSAWVEWKPYKEVQIPMGQGLVGRGPYPYVRENVERLVSLLQIENRPKEFCVPSCKGYFVVKGDNPRFGLVYEVAETAYPQSLWSLFNNEMPSLSTRVRLAQKLAECIGYLHTVNWLHKGIRSPNILLSNCAGDELGSVYLSGLEYARPDEASWTTTAPVDDYEWGVYTNPDYLGHKRLNGYRKTYDIYSLGIVLLEIAHWTSADKLLGFGPAADSGSSAPLEKNFSNLNAVRSRLLESPVGVPDILGGVKKTMGNRYHAAVRACLVGMTAFHLNDSLDQSDPVIAALLQQSYLSLVVDCLKSIQI